MSTRAVRTSALRWGRAALGVVGVLAVCSASACAGGTDAAQQLATGPRLNEIQFIASHNSYHVRAEPQLFDTMLKFAPELVRSIEYTHPSLDQQFDLGVRGIELDVVADPEGGLYSERSGPKLLKLPSAGGPPELDAPGFKVLHVQDIDYGTTCLTLVACLATVEEWSVAHPNHLPIVVQIEPKADAPDLPGIELVQPIAYTPELMKSLDAEIRSVFSPRQIIEPGDIQGDDKSLAAGLKKNGWPVLDDVRGKVLFALDTTGPTRDALLAAFPATKGSALFPSSSPGDSFAAYAVLNDPHVPADQTEIARALAAGMLVRTRTDADLIEGRSGDLARRTAAFASGAQVISTDFFRRLPDIGGDFLVELPGGVVARCNPVTAPKKCAAPTE